jgi:plasmid stabilization system protein ParE
MKIDFHLRAEAELDSAYEYYEQQKRGLGKRFIREISAAVLRIKHYPEAWQPIENQVRRCQTQHFPYAVIYRIYEDKILIIAITHLRRKPNYWQNRIN